MLDALKKTMSKEIFCGSNKLIGHDSNQARILHSVTASK